MATEMPRQETGAGVVSSAGIIADDQQELPALVEVVGLGRRSSDKTRDGGGAGAGGKMKAHGPVPVII
jgi:hypothetical protein